jgi:predicted transcriptional regulator
MSVNEPGEAMTDVAAAMGTLSVNVPNALLARLETLAQKTGRSRSFLVSAALAEYLEYTEKEVDAVLEALEELESGTPGIPHEVVVDWLKSLGTENELPRPRSGSA